MNYHIIIITAALIGMDFITGIVKAASAEGIQSSKMRQGLFHKVGLALCVVLALILDYAQTQIDIGLPVTVPCCMSVCGYIILMEVSSIVENLCIITPELMPDKLRALFGLGDEKEGEKDEKNT